MSTFSERDIFSYLIVTLTQIVDLLKKHTQQQENFYFVEPMNPNLMNQSTPQVPIGTNAMVSNGKSENLKNNRKQKVYPNSMPVL